MLAAACAVAAIALILAAFYSKASRSFIPQLFIPLMVLIGLSTVAGLMVAEPQLRLGLLELGALLTIPLVWQSARTLTAKLTYLTVVLISALSLVGSDLLTERGEGGWARALLLTSVCVKLAAVPLFFWLLSLADELPAVVLGTIIAVVDMAAFGEFWLTARPSHALAKALLFVCLSAPEADGALTGEATGLATRYPVSAFGFLFGMLAMLGIPPMMGFLGRWRLYETALQINPLLLTVFVLSSIFALIAYVLALTRVWWGPAQATDPPLSSPSQPVAHPTSEPLVLQGVIVALVGMLLLAGCWPGLLGTLMGGKL